jgi:hypothetical protein
MEIEAPPNLDNKDEAQAWLEKLWRGIQDDHLKGSKTWDPGNIAANGHEHEQVTVNNGHEHEQVTVNGAALGDHVLVSFSLDLTDDLEIEAFVSTADTVDVHIMNHGAGATDLAEGTVYVRVFKKVT